MTEREIAEVLRAVPWRCRKCSVEYQVCWQGCLGKQYLAHDWVPEYPAMARAVVERVVGPLDRRAADMWQEIVADRDARLARLGEALDEPFHAGTRVTNCVNHMHLHLTERPEDCRLCLTDLRNHLSFAVRVNEFLNAKVERARAALADAGAGKERGDAESADQADAGRWRLFARSPQTALMLGSTLDPNDKDVDWYQECNRLADAGAGKEPTDG